MSRYRQLPELGASKVSAECCEITLSVVVHPCLLQPCFAYVNLSKLEKSRVIASYIGGLTNQLV